MSQYAPQAPDKGSFPLDHFHECDDIANKYNQCVVKHELMPKRCRQLQIDYLECRMKSGLMEKQDIQKLGFTKQGSWENEEAEQKFLYSKIQQLKEKGWQNAFTQIELQKAGTAEIPAPSLQILEQQIKPKK